VRGSVSARWTRNPLTLTGLVLAGANRSGKDAAADQDILTGEAIAGMDLDGMDLAVLSACETRLGEDTREGVYALPRRSTWRGAGTWWRACGRWTTTPRRR